MSEAPPACTRCGDPLESAGSWCPRCALADLVEGESAGPGLFPVPGHVVEEEIGRGASGIVYRARQRDPDRVVALKILRPHEAASEEMRLRFRVEAATVASLDHPGILPVYAVGEADGLPYFTMKLCAGTLAGRLADYRGRWRDVAALMAAVAGAVDHAHARGVLHRDLKPGNLFFDEGGRCFVGDFGLAKAVAESGAPATRPLVVMGTPGYLAPEVLARGAAAAVTGSDVFALGAILHELLAGAPPAAGGAASLVPEVPRDLALITAHCLAPDPARRYATAAALAADLSAWLESRPLAVRPPTAGEQLLAWARGHRTLAAVLGTSAVALALVAVVASLSVVRLREEQAATAAALARAETAAATSRAVTDFLRQDLLAQASPDEQPEANLSVRTLLERAAARMDGRFPTEPLVEAAVRETVAGTYGALGDYERMRGQLERTVALRRARLGPDQPETLQVEARLAEALRRVGRLAEAESLAREVLARQRTRATETVDRFDTQAVLGRVLRQAGRLAEAERELRAAIAGRRQLAGPDDRGALEASRELATLLVDEHQFAAAAALAADTAAAQARLLGAEHPTTLRTRVTLGSALQWGGRHAEAEPILTQALAAQRRVLGPEHPDTLDTLVWLGALWTAAHQDAAARAALHEALQVRERVWGPEHPLTLEARNYLGVLLHQLGDFRGMKQFAQESAALKSRALGPEHPDTLVERYHVGIACLALGEFSAAEAVERDLLAVEIRVLGWENGETVNTQKILGQALVWQGRVDEGLGLLRDGVARAAALRGEDRALLHHQRLALAAACVHAGRWTEAGEVVAALPVPDPAATDRPALSVMELLAQVRLAAGDMDAAAAWAERLVATRERLYPEEWQTASAQAVLGDVRLAQGRTAEAAAVLRRAWDLLGTLGERVPATSPATRPVVGTRLAAAYDALGDSAAAAAVRRSSSAGGG